MSDERLLLTWFGQFMTEPRYPELVAGDEIDEAEFFAALGDGKAFVRDIERAERAVSRRLFASEPDPFRD